MVALPIFYEVAVRITQAESGQQPVGPLTGDSKSTLNLIRDLHRIHRSNVLNLPHLNPLPKESLTLQEEVPSRDQGKSMSRIHRHERQGALSCFYCLVWRRTFM
jgi:hypothetical protein